MGMWPKKKPNKTKEKKCEKSLRSLRQMMPNKFVGKWHQFICIVFDAMRNGLNTATAPRAVWIPRTAINSLRLENIVARSAMENRRLIRCVFNDRVRFLHNLALVARATIRFNFDIRIWHDCHNWRDSPNAIPKTIWLAMCQDQNRF